MKLNGFLDELHHLVARSPCCYAPRQVWHVCTETRFGFLNHNQVLHISILALLT
jgi:hypothetical protein